MYANMSDEDEEGEEEEGKEVVEEEEEEGGAMDEGEEEGEEGAEMDVESPRTEQTVTFADEVEEAEEMDDQSVVTVATGTGGESAKDALHRLEAADLAARSIRVDRPFVLAKSLNLREYQQVGVNWLVSLHERRLNGILADEMGLGKTVQTIALLAYLAVHRGLWGPHLIIVPTSCIINWETEFKKFCPIFKVLTYFGSAKRRKLLRSGWSRLNSFHVCITSYQIVVQDSNAFRRKRWYYMILDEAHNIKNFKSKRWQTLLNFNTQRRLLLTGTPLQNNLMELWSLMHFLMPHIFRSRKEFSYWFSNPLSGMVEGNRGINNDLIARLHSIMRPFLLRRLKKDVAKQLPGKFEHIVMCRLSKRQLHLYEEFMARSATKSSLTGGGFLGMMNILMQLRKVCNHPDLFEPRPISSPFAPAPIVYRSSPLFVRALERGPLDCVSPSLMHFWQVGEDSLVREGVRRLAVGELAFVQVEDVALGGGGGGMSVPVGAQFLQYAQQLRAALQRQQQDRRHFNYKVVSARTCRPFLPCDWRMLRAVRVHTPMELALLARHDPRIGRHVPALFAGLICDTAQRARQMEDVVRLFVFVIPPVVTSAVQLVFAGMGRTVEESLAFQFGPKWLTAKRNMQDALMPFYPARMRQRIFFPDRKLVQFDSGKLQALAKLLQRLKQGGHKCLIFTQMSKMLDILEIFLNLNNHTFVRLDGSTGIDKRQKLMDRFNSDPKLFVFILSTRSGGLGINLTGADSVIFYDTDWNPAMDAQAQDRAHRIGQTREVHIYRLVSESTVEENILQKAKQKRHLDFLVMTEGNFSADSIYSSSGLKDVLGLEGGAEEGGAGAGAGAQDSARMEAAMLAAEDEEDVTAMKAATAEAAQELNEFDDGAPAAEADPDADPDLADEEEEGAAVAGAVGTKGASSAGVVVGATAAEEAAKEDRELESEFASWQASVGPDFKALENALKPIERYALRVRTELDPYYSIFYVSEQARVESLQDGGEHWNVDEIEKEKEEEELRALSEGELLATNITRRDVTRLKSWYVRERARRVSARRMRLMTGQAWASVVDPDFHIPYWYNSDTGEAAYSTPLILMEQERLEQARLRGFSAMPLPIMLMIFSYLAPYPDRFNAAPLCARWAEAVAHSSFYKRVLPVETGARDPSNAHKLTPGVFASVADAVAAALPGDTIELGAGHHWENCLRLDQPLRIVGAPGAGGDASKCVVELLGQVLVLPQARSVLFFGLTLRRPRSVPGATSSVLAQSGLAVYNCVINNEGAKGAAISAVGVPWLRLCRSQVRGGSSGIQALDATVLLDECMVSDNKTGILLANSRLYCRDSTFRNNTRSLSRVGGQELVGLSFCELGSPVFGPELVTEGVFAQSCSASASASAGAGVGTGVGTGVATLQHLKWWDPLPAPLESTLGVGAVGVGALGRGGSSGLLAQSGVEVIVVDDDGDDADASGDGQDGSSGPARKRARVQS
ncbi:SNF2 family N-terminal domain-containing protein [Ochromonadaceae sp. CCMP2298]|nr:SNF2 family N-terminal domain-containing protein [Ochromonadaceae sp. CCMP2298]